MNFEEFYEGCMDASAQITWEQDPKTRKETVSIDGPMPITLYGAARILATVAARSQLRGLSDADELIDFASKHAKNFAAEYLGRPDPTAEELLREVFGICGKESEPDEYEN